MQEETKPEKFKPLPPLHKGLKKSCCSKFVDAVWSVRYKKRETAHNNELFLRTTIRNLVLYIIFLAAVTIMNFGFVTLLKFYISDGLTKLFLDIPIRTGETLRNGFPLHEDIWEIATNSCTVPSVVSSLIPNCYTQYDSSKIEKGAFGKGLKNISSTDITYAAWFYSVSDTESTDRQAIVSTYPPNGYAIGLGDTQETFLAIVSDLKANRWIDLNTRLVTIDFTIYNGNINLFSQIKLILEFPATGGILSSWSFNTVKLLRYVESYDFFILACELVYVFFILFYTIEEILDIHFHKLKYFKDIYNLLDVAIILLSYVYIPFTAYRDWKAEVTLEAALADTSSFHSFSTLAAWTDALDKIGAIILFFSWLKIFKFVSINRTLNQLNETLGNCATEISSFMVIFTIFFVSYAGAGYLLFGTHLEGYNTFTGTLFTLFRIILGDFDFVKLRAFSPYLGPIYFISYIFFCFFILMNMFVAIIGSSYSTVKEENARSAPDFMLSDYLKLNYARIVEKLTLRKNRILDIQDVIEHAKKNNLTEITFDVWRKELRKKGYADSEIESIFCKYDVDGDRILNQHEKIRLMVAIEKAKANVTQEFRDFKNTHKDGKSNNDEFSVGETKGETSEPTKASEKTEKDGQILTADANKDRYMSRDDFNYTVDRIDRMELLIAGIISKIDKIFLFLELMEIEKIKRRQDILTEKPENY